MDNDRGFNGCVVIQLASIAVLLWCINQELRTIHTDLAKPTPTIHESYGLPEANYAPLLTQSVWLRGDEVQDVSFISLGNQ